MPASEASRPPAVTCSAPGSIMLSGEHAVLHGYHALVGAVDRRVTVTLTPRNDGIINIISALGTRSMPATTIDDSRPFHFLGSILKKYAGHLQHGLDIRIKSDFPADIGLGSSSAVTAATLAALQKLINGTLPEREALLRESLNIIRKVQGRGSGADVAASVYGGVLLYRQTPEVISRYTALPPITLVYAGYKTPTPQVIEIVEKQRAQSPDGFKTVFDRIELFTMAADKALRDRDWQALGGALSRGQLMMEMLGVCDEPLADIIAQLSADPAITGAKISGSGLGDCVVAAGRLTAPAGISYRIIEADLAAEGVLLEAQ